MPDLRQNQSRCSGNKIRLGGGFTLIELCLVILVMAILVSLVSAALNHTQRKTFQFSCLTVNLKQLQLGWLMYVEDNGDNLPLSRTAPGPINTRFFGRRNSTNSWVSGNPKEDVSTTNIERGTMFPYIKSTQIYRCPLDKSKVAGNKNIFRTRSYSISAYLNGDNGGVDPRVKTKYEEIVNPPPEKVFVFIEEHEMSLWGSSFLVLPREKFSLTTGSWSSTPSDRHIQGCNLSFADGHVEHWKWSSPKSANLNNRWTSNAKELKDLRRLQSAVPKP